MEGKRNKIKEQNRSMFFKIWLRIGIPILTVTIVALVLFANLFLVSVEMLQGSRLKTIGTEGALILSGEDLTDRAQVDEFFRFSSRFHVVWVLFDPEDREAARSDFYSYTEDLEMLARYQEMEENLLGVHEGRSDFFDKPVNVFDYNYWYEERPVPTPQGEYTLYCASVTATWPSQQRVLICLGLVILAVMVVLTLFIARSYYKIYKKQQALEEAYSQKVNALAHDLKTPMMVISGYSENFLAEIQTGKKTHYAEKILENVNKMNAIVEEMLEFTGIRQTG